MSPSAPCSVVVLNYNGRHLLEACLGSVLGQEYGEFEVLLVDNGSTDGSTDWARSRFPGVRIVDAGSNLGFAGGNNLGVRCASHQRIVLLNNDTVVRPGWLRELMAALEDPGMAVVSSLVITRGIPEKYYERNGSLNFLGHNIMRAYHVPEHIFYCTGASLAFKKDLLREPFDGDYFAYSEDVYLSLRARFMGYGVAHVGSSVVDHLGGATAGRTPAVRVTMLQERNRLLNLLVFFSPWTLVRISPYLLLNIAAKAAGALAGRYSPSGILQAYAWLLSHPRVIARKRESVRKDRRVGDEEVVGWMTGRLTNAETTLQRFVDWISLAYCRAVGLRTLEFFPPETR
jgi:hypothetical protein